MELNTDTDFRKIHPLLALSIHHFGNVSGITHWLFWPLWRLCLDRSLNFLLGVGYTLSLPQLCSLLTLWKVQTSITCLEQDEEDKIGCFWQTTNKALNEEGFWGVTINMLFLMRFNTIYIMQPSMVLVSLAMHDYMSVFFLRRGHRLQRPRHIPAAQLQLSLQPGMGRPRLLCVHLPRRVQWQRTMRGREVCMPPGLHGGRLQPAGVSGWLQWQGPLRRRKVRVLPKLQRRRLQCPDLR